MGVFLMIDIWWTLLFADIDLSWPFNDDMRNFNGEPDLQVYRTSLWKQSDTNFDGILGADESEPQRSGSEDWDTRPLRSNKPKS